MCLCLYIAESLGQVRLASGLHMLSTLGVYDRGSVGFIAQHCVIYGLALTIQ